MTKTTRVFGALMGLLIVFGGSTSVLALDTGFAPLQPMGPKSRMEALDPVARKWYVPQELAEMYGWKGWEYSNYAKDLYKRYTDVILEGYRFYDIYGNYITRGWKIYDWQQNQPENLGSSIYKHPYFSKWFDNILISSSSKGQYHMAMSIGEQLRTTFTPLTFSKPTFSGIQWDFLSDKYAATIIGSRISGPGTALANEGDAPARTTDFTNLFGFRGVIQLGDFTTVGVTYVGAMIGNAMRDLVDTSLKGNLSSRQNTSKVREITVRISDDSPESSESGAILYAQQIYIDGKPVGIAPLIRGGEERFGNLEARGAEQIALRYDITQFPLLAEGYDISKIENIRFELVLTNDYNVDVTSDVQVDANGMPVYLPVQRARGEVRDATNQRFVRFDYGLPTGNSVYGVTLELEDVAGFDLRAEYDVNARYRRFPNPNPEIFEHSLATEHSSAFYMTVSKLAYPWFAYGEVFNMDPEYSTTMYLTDDNGDVFYDNRERYWFEFVDDNDDQDRYPDWNRSNANQRAGWDDGMTTFKAIFPGLDENNDGVSDFNQNDNLWPDYDEPFLKYSVDPPEYLFGLDMNNNTVIDRFENDEEADYPYKRDHRGYNLYGGAEVLRGLTLKVGHMNEWMLSKDRRNRSFYGLLTLERDYAGLGKFRFFDYAKVVKDDIADDLVQWEQLPNVKGGLVRFSDPLMAQNTTMNSAYASFDYTGIERFQFVNKLKYDFYHQRDARAGYEGTARLLALINKADYRMSFGKNLLFEPKFKSMYLRKEGFPGTADRKELSEILFLVLKYGMFGKTWTELGVQGTLFRDKLEEMNDFEGLVYAFQLSNVSDFMGYKLTSNVGFRTETQYFDGRTKTGSVAFMTVFAGVE